MYCQPKVQVHFVFLFGGAIEVDVFAWALCFLPVVVETRNFSSPYMLCLISPSLSQSLSPFTLFKCYSVLYVYPSISTLIVKPFIPCVIYEMKSIHCHLASTCTWRYSHGFEYTRRHLNALSIIEVIFQVFFQWIISFKICVDSEFHKVVLIAFDTILSTSQFLHKL